MLFFALRRDFKYELSMNFDEENEKKYNFIDFYEGNEKTQKEFNSLCEIKEIRSFDGLSLKGWFLKNNSHNYIICCHGYKGNHAGMASAALEFYSYGYNVLCPDARSHGQSEGKFIGMGALEKKDIAKWMDLIIENDSQANIALYGVSMGGATVMMTMCHYHRDNLKCVVEDCGYYSVYEQFKSVCNTTFKMPSFPILDMMNIFCRLFAKYDLKKSDIRQAMKNNNIPCLFIHGNTDDFVPYKFVKEIYDLDNGEKELYIVENAGHAFARVIGQEEYRIKVKSFLDKYI